MTEFTPMKRVLIITYYWPPSGGPGVQRCLFFAKYFREFGWEPVIFTVKNGEYPVIDESLNSEIPTDLEVLKFPIKEPYKLYKKFTGLKKKDRLKPRIVFEKRKFQFTQELAIWIRGNFFIPDARMWWIRPSVKFLKRYISEHPVDAIFSCSPPQSVHLIGKKLAKEFGIPWIADFRDPWTQVDYFNRLKLTSYARKKHEKMEKSVFEEASLITTTSSSNKKEFKKLTNKRIDTLTNGFDDAGKIFSPIPNSDKFTISYLGSLSRERNPNLIWKAISELVQYEKGFAEDLKIVLAGPIDPFIFKSLNRNGLDKYLDFHQYIPHKEIPDFLDKSHLLILIGVENSLGVIPGKMFEYLYSGRQILAISPTGSDIESIINETQSGINIEFEEEGKIKPFIAGLYQKFQKNQYPTRDYSTIEKYSRKNITQALSERLNEITGE